jgi:hypothetical protein
MAKGFGKIIFNNARMQGCKDARMQGCSQSCIDNAKSIKHSPKFEIIFQFSYTNAIQFTFGGTMTTCIGFLSACVVGVVICWMETEYFTAYCPFWPKMTTSKLHCPNKRKDSSSVLVSKKKSPIRSAEPGIIIQNSLC